MSLTTIRTSNLDPSNSLLFRNRIINGAMVIDQRNAGASFSSPNSYTVDRWAFSNGGGQTYTAQQSSTVPTGAGFSKSLIVTNTNSVAAGTTNYNCLYQIIEGYNIADLAWGTAGAKTVTASFWVRSSVTGTYGFTLRGGSSTSYYVSSYSIPVADTWTYVTLTIPGCTTDTWGSTNALGLTVYFDLGVGSTYSASAGFWGTGNVFGLTGGIKFSATNGATFYATGVQLEVGTAATAFERRPFGMELALCQRYYEKFGINQRQFWTTNGQMTTKPYSYKATKRATPSVSISGAYTVDGWTSYTVESHNNPSGAYDPTNILGISATSSGSSNTIAQLACNITSDAEL